MIRRVTAGIIGGATLWASTALGVSALPTGAGDAQGPALVCKSVAKTLRGVAFKVCRLSILEERKKDFSRPPDRLRRNQVTSKTARHRQRQPQHPRQCVMREWTVRSDFAPHYLKDDCPTTRRPNRPRRPDEPSEPVRPRIELITDEIVLSEIRKLDFPASMVHLQPRGKTLVNLDTNVYADRKGTAPGSVDS